MAINHTFRFLASVTLITYVLASPQHHHHHKGGHRKPRQVVDTTETPDLDEDIATDPPNVPDVPNTPDEADVPNAPDVPDSPQEAPPVNKDPENGPPPAEPPSDRDINTAYKHFDPHNLFIDENQLSPNEESFELRQREFVVVHKALTFSQAALFCETSFQARLAVLTLEDPVMHSKWMADALAEIDPERAIYWIGGKNINHKHKWIDTLNKNIAIEDFAKSLAPYTLNRTDNGTGPEKACLGIARKNHNLPLLVDVDCKNFRPFICERTVVEDKGGSTHKGWIRIEDWDFKIFSNLETHDNASKRCFETDANAHLAVIPDEKTAKILSHYLLTGRPSIENAWIGARYDANVKSWVFFPTKELIPSEKTNGSDYPGWLGQTAKPEGCGLLDRHITNHNYLLEARCYRRKPFICSRKVVKDDGDTDDFPDVEDEDVRLYLNQLSFYEAKKACTMKKGKLAEPRTKLQLDTFINLMGENRTTVDHLWVGLEYQHKDQQWHYSSDGSALVDLFKPLLVLNDTYNENIEQNYTCMSLDRENHLQRMLYGTDCSYQQAYYCSWIKGHMPSEKPTNNTEAGDGGKKVETEGPPAEEVTEEPEQPIDETSSMNI